MYTLADAFYFSTSTDPNIAASYRPDTAHVAFLLSFMGCLEVWVEVDGGSIHIGHHAAQASNIEELSAIHAKMQDLAADTDVVCTLVNGKGPYGQIVLHHKTGTFPAWCKEVA